MFRFLVLLFILVPIVEIAVFIQLGGFLGMPLTLLIVILTAVFGVHLIKQQGLKDWRAIQLRLAQGDVPALEMLAAVQLLFAAGLLLTPGFVTDTIGFSLTFPSVRMFFAQRLIQQGIFPIKESSATASTKTTAETSAAMSQGRIIEGEFEAQATEQTKE